MLKYTRNLKAEDIINYIASDYFELSHDKVRYQRDHWREVCSDWIKHNWQGPPSGIKHNTLNDDF